METYAGIQRDLNEKRAEEIRQYVNSFDASFPNTFIVSVKSEDILSDENGQLSIRAHEGAASIIDGQHRLAGFSDYKKNDFDLIVSIFIDLPLEDQAMLFATINLKQTKVNASLVYDLYGETKLRSPQKTCHNISKLLNEESSSPFFHRIKPLGKSTDEYTGILTQATFVKRLLPMVCKNPDEIRDELKKKEDSVDRRFEKSGLCVLEVLCRR
jgi:DGQHR domain-containing protein